MHVVSLSSLLKKLNLFHDLHIKIQELDGLKGLVL